MTDTDITADTISLSIDSDINDRAVFEAFMDDAPVALHIGDFVLPDCLVTDYDAESGTVHLATLGDISLARQPTND